jgi:hypothetical protein
MVIGERFAWAHLPKTGGDATAAMFAAVPGLIQFADPPDSEAKHSPFFAREREIEGRLRVMNLRRLPAWALSGAHHEARYGRHPDYRPRALAGAEEITSRRDADDLLRWMTDHGRLSVDRWLRMESLERDLLGLLSELQSLTDEVAERVRAVGEVNVGDYDRRLPRTFTATQMQRLYELNPCWAGLEQRLYGALMTIDSIG